jgi:hypothetical protein
MKNVGGHGAEVGAVDVIGDTARSGPHAQIFCEAVDVDVELLRIADQIVQAECILMVEQQVVHFPERALVRGGLRRLGRSLRVRMDVVERQVAPDVADAGVLIGRFGASPGATA